MVDQPIRSLPGSRRAAAVNEPTSPAWKRSVSAPPRIASYTIALSSTERVSGPVVPSAHHRCGSGAVVTRPRWGLSPKSPQQAAGIRIEPPPSPPIAAAAIPVATATALPPLDPPGERVGSQGLRVGPNASDSV